MAALMAMLLAAATPPGQAAQAAPAAVEADEIVVRAVRRRCQVEAANRVLSDREFDARAAEWAAGRPVRVYAPLSSDYKCLARIAFRLNDRGVRLIHFVDRPSDE
ncbi:MAG: hypothetical protein ACK4K7_02915 [Allosphingosinicella sp.]|uniref:hypothetical protein n=1 Tax=Allosphingosinicella sp. TaxID=2823234 RepID=UPI00395A94B4